MADPLPVIPNPITELNPDDPGDQILERFRFQVTYSGILAVHMAEGDQDIEEIYCELHEDVLVRHKDGKFTGIQVKTKDINLPPFTIEDDAVIKACIKFAKLEEKFVDCFRNYSIVSNTGFDKSKPAVCLNTIIEEVKTGKINNKRTSKFWTFIRHISKEAQCSTEKVFSVLGKLRLLSVAKLEDIHYKLINRLKLCPLLKGIQESKIEEIAELLIGKHFQAASLGNLEETTAKFIMGVQSDLDDAKKVIAGKRFRKEDVVRWFNVQKDIPVALLLKDRNRIANIPKGHRRLEVKMDAGGIDSDNIELVRNFKYAFENHAISWMYKEGADRAEEKYSQVSVIVQNECKEIYDAKSIRNNDNGQEMLVDVRNTLRTRRQSEPELFFDCTHEHLLGAVGVLTESCKVWWSKPFDIDEKL